MTLHKLSKCCWCWCYWIIVHLRLNECWNRQFGYAALLISFMEVLGCILPSRLCQLVKLHLLLPKPLDVLLHRFGDCAHHPAGFVIFAQLALLCLFIILIFPILPIVRTGDIAQTVSDSNHHPKKRCFTLSGCQSRVFSSLCIFLLLPARCLCIFNSLSWPSGFYLNIIVDRFLFLLIDLEVRFLSFLGRKRLFGSQAAQCRKGSDSFCFQTGIAFICMMTSLGGQLCRFGSFARRKRPIVLFWSIDCWSFCWLRCWARCWVLQVLDNMEASCVFYVKVGTFTHLEQSQISLLTVNKFRIVKLPVQHDFIVSVSFM